MRSGLAEAGQAAAPPQPLRDLATHLWVEATPEPELGFDVTIYYYPPTARPLGAQHNSIQVNSGPTYGFYPQQRGLRTGLSLVPGFVVSGEIRLDDPRQATDSVTISTTRAQDVLIETIIREMVLAQARYEQFDFYNLVGVGGNNCATFVTYLLRAAGLKVPALFIPEDLVPSLAREYGPDFNSTFVKP